MEIRVHVAMSNEYTVYPDEAMTLWYKVLKLAVEDLDEPFERTKAMRWFISNSTHIGSFLWICDVLDIDAQLIRTALSKKIYYLFN